MWSDERWKVARRCGAKHSCKSKRKKHLTFGALLEVAMSKKCTPLWREAHFPVKMYKTHQLRTTFGSWDVQKVYAVLARSTFRSQNVQNTTRHSHLPITIWIMMPSTILTIIHIMIFIMIHILIHMITIQHQDKSFSPWRAVATSPLGLLTGFISLFRLEIRSATQATRNEYNWSAAEDHDVYKTLNGKKLSPPDEHFPLNNFVLLMNIFN